jgi:hypothetical protein
MCRNLYNTGIMGKPLLLAIYKQPWSQVDRALGKPRAIGANHSFHEYSRPEGGYFVRFEKGVAVQIIVTLRRPAATAEKALAVLGVNTAGRRPNGADALEVIWTGLYGTGGLRVRSSNAKTWDTVEARVKSVAALP